MKKDRIVLDFVKIPYAHKIEFGRNVEKMMTGNTSFEQPEIPVDVIKAKTDTLETRYVASLSGGKQETILLSQAADDWNETIRKTAKYVDKIADGDAAIIVSAGFNLAKQPSPANRPEFSVELGEKSGSVVLRRQAVDGAKSYVWQLYQGDNTPVNEADWVTAQISSKVTVEITGLIPKTTYWFRSAVVTTNGVSAYNSPLMQVVI